MIRDDMSADAGGLRESWNLKTRSSFGIRTSGRLMLFLLHAEKRGKAKATSAGVATTFAAAVQLSVSVAVPEIVMLPEEVR